MSNVRKRKVGQLMKWVSGSQGVEMEKIGKIIEVVPKNTYPDVFKYKKTHLLSMIGYGQSRNHISYLIEVPRFNKKNEPLKSFLYWPRVNFLRKVKG